jgi:hypothetical protein
MPPGLPAEVRRKLSELARPSTSARLVAITFGMTNGGDL